MIESARRTSTPPDLFFKYLIDKIFEDSPVPIRVFTETQQKVEYMPMVVLTIKPRTGAYIADRADQGHLTEVLFTTNVVVNAEDERWGDPLDLAHEIQEALRIGFEEARRQQWYHPVYGSLSYYKMAQPAANENDWATGTNIVQYASLPDGTYRFEATHRAVIRASPRGFGNRFIKHTS